jgi:hypothetical protein
VASGCGEGFGLVRLGFFAIGVLAGGFLACAVQLGNEVESAFLWRVPAVQAVVRFWRGAVVNLGGWRKQL